jgi:predicted secreted protein
MKNIHDYIEEINKNDSVKVYLVGLRNCTSCDIWTKEVLVPTCLENDLEVEIIYSDETFIPFKPEMAPTTYFYTKDHLNPIMIVGEQTVEHINALIKTAKARLEEI